MQGAVCSAVCSTCNGQGERQGGWQWPGQSGGSEVKFVHLTNKYLEEQYRILYIALYLEPLQRMVRASHSM